jgi:hypothetical protein
MKANYEITAEEIQDEWVRSKVESVLKQNPNARVYQFMCPKTAHVAVSPTKALLFSNEVGEEWEYWLDATEEAWCYLPEGERKGNELRIYMIYVNSGEGYLNERDIEFLRKLEKRSANGEIPALPEICDGEFLTLDGEDYVHIFEDNHDFYNLIFPKEAFERIIRKKDRPELDNYLNSEFDVRFFERTISRDNIKILDDDAFLELTIDDVCTLIPAEPLVFRLKEFVDF